MIYTTLFTTLFTTKTNKMKKTIKHMGRSFLLELELYHTTERRTGGNILHRLKITEIGNLEHTPVVLDIHHMTMRQ